MMPWLFGYANNVYRHIIAAMIAMTLFLVGTIAWQQFTIAYESTIPAVEWSSKVVVHTPIVKPGDTLRMTYTLKVNKVCPADIRGFIMDEKGYPPVRYPLLSGGYVKQTNGKYVDIDINVIVPLGPDAGLESFKPGRYFYRQIVTRFCAEGIQEDVGAPDAPFRIELQKGYPK